MSDLKERLRRGVFDAETGNYNDIGLCDEAANRIEQLEAALRSVFQPGGWTHSTDCQCSVCQEARAALEERT